MVKAAPTEVNAARYTKQNFTEVSGCRDGSRKQRGRQSQK